MKFIKLNKKKYSSNIFDYLSDLIDINNVKDISNEIEKEMIDNIIQFIKYIEYYNLSTLIYTKKLWHKNFKERSECYIAFDLMIKFYYDVLRYKLNLKSLLFSDFIEIIKDISNNNDISDAKQETSIKQENTVNNKNNSNNSNNSSTIKDNNPSNSPIENKQEVVTPKEDVTPQVDPEYERLKSLIKYKDDMECYNASLDVSLEYLDDENFQVITCSSYAYKGKLLGYRMAVHYWDGTVVYLDAID